MKKIKTTNVTAAETDITELDVTNSLMNMSQTGNKLNVQVLLFWSLYLLSVVIVSFFIVTLTVKGINAGQLEGAFTEKQYTQTDINELTTALKERLNEENSTMHPAYRLDMTLMTPYQVYSSEQGDVAMVIYTVKFRNNSYTIIGYTRSNYFNGLNTLLDLRNKQIKDGNYTWDSSYIPKDDETIPVVTPTPLPTYTESGIPITSEIDDEDIVIERGGEEEEN